MKPVLERTAARVIVRDCEGRLLLFKGMDTDTPEETYWFTPGGGCDEGENYEEAAARELVEEGAIKVLELGAAVREDLVEFPFQGTIWRQQQRYFAVELRGDLPDVMAQRASWTEIELVAMIDARWWAPTDLAASGENYYPEDLLELVASIDVWGDAVAF
jgi:ADP-ribose pyrophosphatase YjhB (NUDIX family)